MITCITIFLLEQLAIIATAISPTAQEAARSSNDCASNLNLHS